MFGSDAFGFHAIGEDITNAPPPLVYEPVSRIAFGGVLIRPASYAETGLDLIWDTGDDMIWDDGDTIGWEA